MLGIVMEKDDTSGFHLAYHPFGYTLGCGGILPSRLSPLDIKVKLYFHFIFICSYDIIRIEFYREIKLQL